MTQAIKCSMNYRCSHQVASFGPKMVSEVISEHLILKNFLEGEQTRKCCWILQGIQNLQNFYIPPAGIPSLVWCDHVINESFPDVYPQSTTMQSDCIIVDWGYIRQNSSFIYSSHNTPHKKWNPCRQYRMNFQQYCSLGNIHADNSLKWAEVGDEARTELHKSLAMGDYCYPISKVGA